MGAYRCDICEGVYCHHDNVCHASPISEYGLLCEDCNTEYVCADCGLLLAYCKITDQYFCTKCEV